MHQTPVSPETRAIVSSSHNFERVPRYTPVPRSPNAHPAFESRAELKTIYSSLGAETMVRVTDDTSGVLWCGSMGVRAVPAFPSYPTRDREVFADCRCAMESISSSVPR